MLVRLVFTLWVCLVALGFAPGAAFAEGRAQQKVDPAARSAFDAGLEAYGRGDFVEALAWFERAHTLSPHPKLMFNIGRAADGDAQYERAIAAYKSYLVSYPEADNRQFVEARVTKLQQLLAASRAGASRGDASSPDLAVRQDEAGAPSLLGASSSVPDMHDQGEARPVWKRGWFWGIAAVVVAGAVATGVALAVRDDGAGGEPKVDETIMTLRGL